MVDCIGFILAAVILTHIITLLTADSFPKYLLVWVNDDGTFPAEPTDKVIGKPFVNENGFLEVRLKLKKRKTYLKRAHAEFLRRVEILTKSISVEQHKIT